MLEKVKFEQPLEIQAYGRQFEFVLTPHDIRAKNYKAIESTNSGDRELAFAKVITYKGKLRDDSDSEVRFTISEENFEGLIYTGDYRKFFVTKAEKFSKHAQEGDAVVYSEEDLVKTVDLSHDGVQPGVEAKLDTGFGILNSKAQNSAETNELNGIEAADMSSAAAALKVIEVATEADYQWVLQAGGATQANNEILSIMNLVDGIYQRDLGLSITITYQHVWTISDPYPTSSMSDQLNYFLDHWNSNYPRSQYPRDTAHLFTGKFAGMGLAYIGAICYTPEYAYGITGRSGSLNHLIVAHEIGHNLGANHVENADSCANSLMNPSLSSAALTFCSTSKTQISNFVSSYGSCLSSSTPSCSYSISPGSASATAAGSTNYIGVTTTTGCAWNAISNANWITITAGNNGTGSGTVTFSVAPNTGLARSGTITVAGQTFTVNQASGATSCSYSINPTNASLASTASFGNGVAVTTSAGCAWTASTNAGWITITGGASGSGSGTVTYSVTLNTGSARSGTITIAGRSFTVNQAAGITSTAGLQYYPLAYPIRLLDTRSGQPTCYSAQSFGFETIRTQPAASVSCQGLQIPASAQAIVGTATALNTPAEGNLRLYPAGEQLAAVSNINYIPGRTVSNSFTVKLGTSGAFNIYSYSPADVIVDVTGYYAAPGTGGLYYHPLPNPIRLLETRPEYNCSTCGYQRPGAPLAANQVRLQTAHISYLGASIPTTARAVTGNATVVSPAAAGKIGLYPGDISGNVVTENINYIANQTIPNAFTVKLDANGQFNIRTTQQTHLLIDITGYYSEEQFDQNGTGLLFNILPAPFRLLDTRAGFQACDAPAAMLGGDSIRVQQVRGRQCGGQQIPSQAKAIYGNATVVNNFAGAGTGNIRLYPGEQPLANASNLNYAPGETIPNSFIVGLGTTNGAVNIYSYSGTHFIVDVSGYFAP